jgi:hypothetical protein
LELFRLDLLAEDDGWGDDGSDSDVVDVDDDVDGDAGNVFRSNLSTCL